MREQPWPRAEYSRRLDLRQSHGGQTSTGEGELETSIPDRILPQVKIHLAQINAEQSFLSLIPFDNFHRNDHK